MKAKRAVKNMFSGIINNFITILLGIVIPKLIIEYYGSEINGMIASVTSILTYLNLLEAGVGAASRQALYEPIVKKDQQRINGILSATTKYYHRTGVYFLACVAVLVFLFPLCVKSDIQFMTVALVIALMAVSYLLNYFFQGKYNVLLNADNRGYVLNTYNTGAIVLIDLSKIALIVLGFDVVLVQLTAVVVTIIKLVILKKVFIDKAYPELDLKAEPDYEAISQKNSVLIIQIKGAIFNNIDVLLLALFVDLKMVSVYAVYSLIFKGVASIPTTLYSGLTAGFGQLYVENFPRFRKLFNAFEVYYMALAFGLMTVTYLMAIPFIRLYTEGVSDVNYVDPLMPLFFLGIHLLVALRFCPDRVVYMAGHFKATQRQATVEMMINLILSVILVNLWGVYGVMTATLVALIYRCIDLNLYTSREILKRDVRIPLRRWGLNLLVTGLVLWLTKDMAWVLSGYWMFIWLGALLMLAVGGTYFILATVVEKDARHILIKYLPFIKN